MISIGKGVRVVWECSTVHSHSTELVNTEYLTLGSLENVAQRDIYGRGRGDVA